MFYQFRVGGYARSIYLDGAVTFEQLAPDYVEPVKVYASKGFTYGQIDEALAKGYINQQQYDDTIALKTAIEPRPLSVAQPTI
ncbi:MAG TPA: hypothetical protein VIK78_00375 [Ruminiclostridium sp.]